MFEEYYCEFFKLINCTVYMMRVIGNSWKFPYLQMLPKRLSMKIFFLENFGSVWYYPAVILSVLVNTAPKALWARMLLKGYYRESPRVLIWKLQLAVHALFGFYGQPLQKVKSFQLMISSQLQVWWNSPVCFIFKNTSIPF